MVKSSQRNAPNWLNFFHERASNTALPSYRVNGFLDPVLVRSIHNTVRKLIVCSHYDLLIDCGCGDGSVTAPLVLQGVQVYGVDFSAEMLRRAQLNGLTPIQRDLETLSGQDIISVCAHSASHQLACILFCESLGCMNAPLQFLESLIQKNIWRADLILAFPNGSALVRQVAACFDADRVNYFDLRLLAKQVSASAAQTRLQDVSAIVSIPFVFAFVVSMSQCPKILYPLIRLFASNYVVRLTSDCSGVHHLGVC